MFVPIYDVDQQELLYLIRARLEGEEALQTAMSTIILTQNQIIDRGPGLTKLHYGFPYSSTYELRGRTIGRIVDDPRHTGPIHEFEQKREC